MDLQVQIRIPVRCRIGYLVLLSKLIAVLSCLSQRRSSQGIDEPADLECRGVPALVASCWAQESPKLSITRSADWRAKPWVAARHGTTATFLEVVQLLQLHFPVPSQEPLLWSFSSRPWFAVVLLGLNDHMQGGVCYDSVPTSAQFPRIFF